jgi:hypothetical protein
MFCRSRRVFTTALRKLRIVTLRQHIESIELRDAENMVLDVGISWSVYL